MRHNVTTPGGFFVGLGGIVAFCVVSTLVYLWVKAPARSTALQTQQVALGLTAGSDAPQADVKAKKAETNALLDRAAQRYNEGKRPDIDRLPELRGVLRYRESQKSLETGLAALNAPSSVEGKTVIQAAIEDVAKEIATKKPVASTIPLTEMGPVDPKAAPALPNYSGGGVRTVNFADPNKPAMPPASVEQPAPSGTQAPAPGTPPAPTPAGTPSPAPAPGSAPPATPTPPPAPAAPQPPAPAPALGGASQPQALTATQTSPVAAAPNRPPLLNWSETK